MSFCDLAIVWAMQSYISERGGLNGLEHFNLFPGRTLMEGKVEELIASLSGAAEFRNDADVRIAALECMGAVMALPYNLLYPQVRKVNQLLSRAVDDPKRAVRMQAARTRRLWNPN